MFHQLLPKTYSGKQCAVEYPTKWSEVFPVDDLTIAMSKVVDVHGVVREDLSDHSTIKAHQEL